jgi:hypothetical protein
MHFLGLTARSQEMEEEEEEEYSVHILSVIFHKMT